MSPLRTKQERFRAFHCQSSLHFHRHLEPKGHDPAKNLYQGPRHDKTNKQTGPYLIRFAMPTLRFEPTLRDVYTGIYRAIPASDV